MQKSSILCLIFLATIAFQIFSYPVSYRHLVRDERHIHLIGDFHVPLTGTTRSEAVLLQRINERAEQKPITVIWEYNQCSPQLKSIREKLYAIEGRSAGFVFVQDAPETLSKKLNFVAADCRPKELNLLLSIEAYNALSTAEQKKSTRLGVAKGKQEKKSYQAQRALIGVYEGSECKSALVAGLEYVDVISSKIEQCKPKVSERDYEKLRNIVDDLKIKREWALKELAYHNEMFFAIFAQGLLSLSSKKITKSALELLNVLTFDVMDTNFMAEIFSTQNDVIVYVGLWHCNVLEKLLVQSFGFACEKEVCGVTKDEDFCRQTCYSIPISKATIFEVPQESWLSL